MIVASDWIWMHVPKCGGSSTEGILRAAFKHDASVDFDLVGPGLPVIWHHNLAKRQAADPDFKVGDKNVVANIRRLPYWLLSRIHFEAQRSQAAGLVPRHLFVKGYYREAPGPNKTPSRPRLADERITFYAAGVTDWVRTEHLQADLTNVFGLTAKNFPAKISRINIGKIDYVRELSFWFTARELRELYKSNPIWAALEEEIYGNLLTLK